VFIRIVLLASLLWIIDYNKISKNVIVIFMHTQLIFKMYYWLYDAIST